MSDGIGGSLISAGAGLVGDLVGLGVQSGLQHEQWRREDSAVRRRVADLRAAGLSPTLAAGSAAGSTAPINVMGQISSAGERVGQAVKGTIELAAMKQGLRKVTAEAGQSEADARRAKAQADYEEAKRPYFPIMAQDEAASFGFRNRSMGASMDASHAAYLRSLLETQILQETGMDRAKAARLSEQIASRMAEAEEKMGGQWKRGIGQWIDFARMIRDLLGR